MTETFTAKVRAVGTSLGILLPKEIVNKSKLKMGEEIEIGLLKKDVKIVEKAFGIAKGTLKFERDHAKRSF